MIIRQGRNVNKNTNKKKVNLEINKEVQTKKHFPIGTPHTYQQSSNIVI